MTRLRCAAEVSSNLAGDGKFVTSSSRLSQASQTLPNLSPNFASPSTRPRTLFSAPQSIETKHSFPSTSYHCVPHPFLHHQSMILFFSDPIPYIKGSTIKQAAPPACVLCGVEDGEQKGNEEEKRRASWEHLPIFNPPGL